ncbi:MAG: 6-phosphogluconolactonase [Rhodocyclaceae bacterium]
MHQTTTPVMPAMPPTQAGLLELHRHTDADSLDAALAEYVLDGLRDGLAARGRASLVVSGGRTPAGLFARLCASPLAWDQVTITLADERLVPPEHADSNARMVRTQLLRDAAATARFVPLHDAAPGQSAAHAAERLAPTLAGLARPFDVVLLGMGEDGHTASLFPAADTTPPLAALPPGDCVAVHPTRAPHPRLSLTPQALLDTRRLALHITGAGKWTVLCEALKPGPAEDLPVRHVLHQARVPCRVYWTR